jgi:hypothetical protein
LAFGRRNAGKPERDGRGRASRRAGARRGGRRLIGGDSGHYEREELVEEVLLAPSERVVVDVLFEQPGELELGHKTPERAYPLATIVGDGSAERSFAERFARLRTNAEMAALREQIAPFLDAEPDKTLGFAAAVLGRTGDRFRRRRPRTDGRDCRHPARRHEPRPLDGALHIAEHYESGMMFAFDVENA